MNRLVRMTVQTSSRGTGSLVKRFPKNGRVSVKMSTLDTSTPFKPWKTAMIESHGDYRAEAHLEDHIGGPLYAKQTSLPRLPIPALQDTMNLFLPTALPLAKSEDEKRTLAQLCQTFPQEAIELHSRLQQRRDGEMKDTSWLQLWWNTWGYLQVRDPVVINVSYFFHFKDDATLPTDRPKNITRGAAILTAAAQFRRQVCSGQFPTETVGRKDAQTPLCSVAFKYMFHACRIPHRIQDTYRIYDPSRHTHCLVARKGHFFAVDFCNETTGHALPLSVLEERLAQCVAMADDASNPPVELGWFTSNNRDDWADARDELVRAGGIPMQEALGAIESGALLLCLDDEEPVSRRQCGELFWHGGIKSGSNRWFDKSVQIFCTNNGKAGLMGEHSMMDGMPMVALANHVTSTSYASAAKQSSTESLEEAPGGVTNIFAGVSDSLESSPALGMLDQAKEHFTKLVSDHELNVQSFQGYGSNFMKQSGFSPDAYVQIAMQLATYRLFGEQVGTYEATQVRPFLHGRTETTRTVSLASEAFIKRMGLCPKYDEHDPEARKEKLSLLQEAVTSHVKYMGKASKGLGVDRHLLGLSMMVKDGETAPDLYSHPLFVRSKRWRVSTSHLTHPNFENWGYGEVVPDGVGLAYAIKADSCVFNITALRECDWTERLCHFLEEALLEMRTIVVMDKPLQSRL